MDAIKGLLTRHLTELCEGIGARPTGSDANRKAVQYAAKTFRDMGYDVNLEEFPCMDWENAGAELVVDGKTMDAVAAEYSLPCDVAGELVCVGNIDELKAANLEGKICVMHGELCKEPLMPKAMVFWNPDEHKAIVQELEAKSPVAVIAVSFLPDIPVSVIQDGDFNVPCVAVKGKLLDTLLQSKEEAILRIKAERRPSTAANVIAVCGEGDTKVSFTAHIDTKANTQGALDNGGGVAVLLALASQIASGRYPYQVEFTLFNGEDYYSTPGETAFMQSHLQTPGKYVCAFNVDGVGLKRSDLSYSFYECPEELQQRVERYASTKDGIERIDPWPMGDHMMFAMCGVPAIAITASNIFLLMESVLHTPNDTLNLVDVDKLAQVVDFLRECI